MSNVARLLSSIPCRARAPGPSIGRPWETRPAPQHPSSIIQHLLISCSARSPSLTIHQYNHMSHMSERRGRPIRRVNIDAVYLRDEIDDMPPGGGARFR